jgi:hypothetical protein
VDFYSVTRGKIQHWCAEGKGVLANPSTLQAFAEANGCKDWAAMKAWLKAHHEMPFHGLHVTWANDPRSGGLDNTQN